MRRRSAPPERRPPRRSGERDEARAARAPTNIASVPDRRREHVDGTRRRRARTCPNTSNPKPPSDRGERDERRHRRQPRLRQRRALAKHRHRRNPRRAHRRDQAGDDGDDDADQQAHEHRPEREDRPRLRQVDLDHLHHGVQELRDQRRRARPRRSSPRGRSRTPRARPSASTCRRDAPIVRSSANSRVRCATVIENVLKMMNAPTKSAIPANASRKNLMNVTKLFEALEVERVRLPLAVCTFVGVPASAPATAARTARRRDARPARDRDRVDLAALVEQRLSRLQVERGDRRRAERVDDSPT